MRYWLIPLVLFTLSSCSDGRDFNRGYVISKSHLNQEADEAAPAAAAAVEVPEELETH